MNRLSVAGALALAVLAVAVQHGAGAQPADKVARVGVLWPGELSPAATQLFARFREALRGLGWVEGRNLALDFRAAEGRSERLPELAAALVETQPDVILTTAPQALQRATATIPIVFVAAAEPVRNGLVRSLSRPGGNLTGSADMPLELHAKRLEVLKDAFPRVRRIAVVWNPTNVLVYDAAGELRAAGPALGVELDLSRSAAARSSLRSSAKSNSPAPMRSRFSETRRCSPPTPGHDRAGGHEPPSRDLSLPALRRRWRSPLLRVEHRGLLRPRRDHRRQGPQGRQAR